ncbi:MAG: hypothetical protein JWM28_2193 [Chitinophagaceae bacterium]|nr:hypothetical protein [Chitinophagaceae bacterium]
MNFLSEQIQLFVTDSLNPQKFAGHHFSNIEFENWQDFLKKEIAALRYNLSLLPDPKNRKNKAEIVTYINQIVDLSNTIYGYLTKLYPVWKSHPQADQIRLNYHYSLNSFEELINKLAASFIRIRGLVRITNYSLPQAIMGLKQKLKLLTAHLYLSNIDERLQEILLTGFTQLMNQKNIRPVDQDYLTHLSLLILNEKELDTRPLMDLLIANDFNLPEFFHYCINYWRKRMSEIPGLHEQLEMLITEKDLLFNTHIKKGLRMPDGSSELYKDLDQFLSEKYAYVKSLLRVRREAIMDKEKAKAGIRFLMNLPVPQFGLFIRMQIEKGLLPKENVGDLFSFFALHFYTPNTVFMSADSLQKKSTDVEFSTAQKMKGQLIGMLNWLNSNFNLSNYN